MEHAEKCFLICILITFWTILEVYSGRMEPFIVGGNFVEISEYPHSAFLGIFCKSQWACGSSILNQKIVLTAGHCVHKCEINKYSEDLIAVLAGHSNLMKVTKELVLTSVNDNSPLKTLCNVADFLSSCARAATSTIFLTPERKSGDMFEVCLFINNIVAPDRKNRFNVFFCLNALYVSRKPDMPIFWMPITRSAVDVKIHENYDEILFENDIALLAIEGTFPLGYNVKRIVISRKFPDYSKSFEAYVAGWGVFNESFPETSMDLKSVYQKLRSIKTCAEIGKIHMGMFCAGSYINNFQHASQGDSGSALVMMNGYHQIGIVSFRKAALFPAMMVYSNVSYYYDWISENSKQLYCNNK